MKHDASFPLLNKSDEQKLEEALHYLHMTELKAVMEKLGVSVKGKKAQLISAIVHFAQTGEVSKRNEMPPVSKASRGKVYPLAPNAPMLYGAYKNDAETRAFFKQLIGDYFHFTAFGIDWLQARWMAGNPPTYREFAEFWKKEYGRRKDVKSPLKREWAYLSFIRAYTEKYPKAMKGEVLSAWQERRTIKVKEANQLLQKVWKWV